MSDSAMSQATFRLTKIIDGDGEVWYSQLSVNLFNERITELEHKLAEAEYQLEQQKIMNPISVNMIATISDLSKKLKVAVKALEFYANNKTTMHLEDGIYLRDGMDGQFVPLKDISIYALKEITNVSEKDKA